MQEPRLRVVVLTIQVREYVAEAGSQEPRALDPFSPVMGGVFFRPEGQDRRDAAHPKRREKLELELLRIGLVAAIVFERKLFTVVKLALAITPSARTHDHPVVRRRSIDSGACRADADHVQALAVRATIRVHNVSPGGISSGLAGLPVSLDPRPALNA